MDTLHSTSIKNQVIKQIIGLIRENLREVGDEYDLTDNEYGFRTAWLEGNEVYWDYQDYHCSMDELTELCALLNAIEQTRKELEN